MPQSLIDVLDTSVKIGLGALISGLATYFVTKTNNSHVKHTELLKRKLDIIENSTIHIDSYFHSLGELLSRTDGILRSMDLEDGNILKTNDKAMKFLKESDEELLLQRKEINLAKSKLHLIMLSNVVNKIDKLTEFENDIRTLIMFNQKIPSNEQLKEWGLKFNKFKKDIYSDISKSYKS